MMKALATLLASKSGKQAFGALSLKKAKLSEDWTYF